MPFAERAPPPVYRPMIIWAAIVLHLLQGLVVLSSSSTNGAVANGSLLLIFPNHVALGLTLILVSITATWAQTQHHRYRLTSLVCLLPQQALLSVVAFGAIWSISQGHYATGEVRSSAFIIVDTLPGLILFVAHTVAILLKVRRGG